MASFDALKRDLKHLSSEPGVYCMKDAAGDVLYVGKAVNLRKRVSSYFAANELGIKTHALVTQIASIDVTITHSETEALLLESSLIKSLRPKYNVLMRDDKSYPYLHLSLRHNYPALVVVRRKKKPQEKGFFGPYPSVFAVRDTHALIQKIFKLRNCSDSFFNARSRPCLQYQLKRCSAPCTALITQEEYQHQVLDAMAFLQGKSQDVLQRFEARMMAAVDALYFEQAALLRDQIQHLRQVQEQQHVIALKGDLDVIALHASRGHACVVRARVRDGQLIATDSFYPHVPKAVMCEETLWQQVFEAFVMDVYQQPGVSIPPLVVTHHPQVSKVALANLLTTWRGRMCHINDKPRGTNARWLDFALTNLADVQRKVVHSEQVLQSRYGALRQILAIDRTVSNMVCFDISHTSGQETVASCVVFDANGPCKRAYRRFNIRDVAPGDDYAAIKQAVYRYFKRIQASDRPQLALIDGGCGQLASAGMALDELGIVDVKLLAIAKGPLRKSGLERYFTGHGEEILIPKGADVLLLLQAIRDEAHRFAITAHRKKRTTASFDSSLLTIAGVGLKRRHALLQRFGGIQALSKASIDEIAKVKGISQPMAALIYQHFHA